MRTSFKRDMNHNYLVVEPEMAMRGDEYQVRMIVMNHIRGLLKCNMKRLDGETYFYYEITSRHSLKCLYEKQRLSAQDIQTLLLSLKTAMEQISGYLLEPDYLLLLPEYIYLDVQTKEACFCYLPAIRESIGSSFGKLAEFVLHALDYKEADAVAAGYELYHQTRQENFSLEAILAGINQCVKKQPHARKEEVMEESIAVIPKKAVLEKGIKKQKPVKKRTTWEKEKLFWLLPICGLAGLWGTAWLLDANMTQAGGLTFLYLGILGYFVSMKKQKKEKPLKYQPEMKNIHIEEEEVREVIKEDNDEVSGQTTILDILEPETLTLISMEPRERPNISLHKEEIVIGKMKAFADEVISLQSISRIHARIIREKDGYYVMDMNSTNGTFINGEQLTSHEKRQIKPGDELTFAMAGYYVSG